MLHAPQLSIVSNDSLPLLDEEFDIFDIEPALDDHSIMPMQMNDELAWDDQIDNGHEMSL